MKKWYLCVLTIYWKYYTLDKHFRHGLKLFRPIYRQLSVFILGCINVTYETLKYFKKKIRNWKFEKFAISSIIVKYCSTFHITTSFKYKLHSGCGIKTKAINQKIGNVVCVNQDTICTYR